MDYHSTHFGVVFCPAAVWLRQRNAGRHPLSSDQADAVDDEFCCSACVFCIEIWLHRAAPHTVALAEGAGADQLQASCSTPDSSAVYRWGIPPVISCWGSSLSPLCFVIIACCPTHPLFNYWRSSFSICSFTTVEHSDYTLPQNVTSASSMSVPRKRLKTHVFVILSPNLLWCLLWDFFISDTIIDLFYFLLTLLS